MSPLFLSVRALFVALRTLFGGFLGASEEGLPPDGVGCALRAWRTRSPRCQLGHTVAPRPRPRPRLCSSPRHTEEPPPNPQGCREWEGSPAHPYLGLLSHPTMGALGLSFSPSLNEILKPTPRGPGAVHALCRDGPCPASRGSRILARVCHRSAGCRMPLLTMCFVMDVLSSFGSRRNAWSERPRAP